MDRSCARPHEACHCLFCLNPVKKDKYNDEQNVDNNLNLIACCKKLLKDKIRGNYNEWFSPAKRSSPLCVKCLKSAEKVHNVNKQLMEINKILDDLIEKFTAEINERLSRLSGYGYLAEEIKAENIITIKDDTDFIAEDNSIELHDWDFEARSKTNCPAELTLADHNHVDLAETSSRVKKINRKSVSVPRLDLYDTDSSLTNAQPDLITSDELQNSDLEEPVPSPVQFFSDGEFDHSDERKLGSRIKEKKNLKTQNFQISIINGRLVKQNKEKTKPECRICGRPTNSSNMHEHLLSHCGEHEKPYRCSFCGKGFKVRRLFKDHVDNFHSSADEGSHVCDVCGNRYKTKLRLQHHLNVHKSFSCSKCTASFKSRLALSRHQNIHDGKVYSCSLCSKSFLSEHLLKAHKKLHHSGDGSGRHNVIECPICKKELKSIQSLNMHIKGHGEKEFVCDICGSQFATKRLLASHSRYHEEEESKCKICAKVFKNKLSLRTHEILLHEKEKNHKCEQCDFRANQKNRLEFHIRNVHEKALDYECSICGKGFSQKPNCQNHEKTHHDKTMRCTVAAFNCDICDNNYTDPNCLRLHQIYFHTAYTQQFADCDKCFNKFSNALELYRHTKGSQRECKNDRFFRKCVYCQKPFESQCDLLCHIINDHPGEEIPYKCQVCSIVLSSPFLLKEHLSDECGKNILVEKRRKQVTIKERTEDTKERNRQFKKEKTSFVCSFCGKSFAGKYNLTLHEEMHRNEEAFGCSFCSKRFIQKSSLQNHERTHIGERPFPCIYCPKAFKHSASLKTHIRIHTGEKPYSCTVCAKKFSDSSTLSKHKKIHTL